MGNVLQNTGGNTLKVHGGGVFGSAPTTAPAAPAVPVITARTTTTLQVEFIADGTATSSEYRYRDMTSAPQRYGAWSTAAAGAAVELATATGLTANTMYEVEARSVNAAGTSGWSTAVRARCHASVSKAFDIEAIPYVTDTNATLTTNAGYAAWAVDPYMMASPTDPVSWPSAATTNMYYIDNGHVAATDTTNTWGYPDKPRLTKPTLASLPAGTVITFGTTHEETFTTGNYKFGGSVGTAVSPIWFRGYSRKNPPVFHGTGLVLENTDYIFMENLQWDGGNDANAVIGTSFNGSGDTKHLVIRACEMKNLDYIGGGGGVIGIKADDRNGGNVVSDIVLYDLNIHDCGTNVDWFTGDFDHHGVQLDTRGVGGDTKLVFITDCDITTVSGNAVQCTSISGIPFEYRTWLHHIFTGGCRTGFSRQGGLWSKRAGHVIFAENTIEHSDGDWVGGNGQLFGCQYGPDNLWYIKNRGSDGWFGFQQTDTSDVEPTQDGRIYNIQNVLSNIHNHKSQTDGWRDGTALSYTNHANTIMYSFSNTVFDAVNGIVGDNAAGVGFAQNNILSLRDGITTTASDTGNQMQLRTSHKGDVNLSYRQDGASGWEFNFTDYTTAGAYDTGTAGNFLASTEVDPLFNNLVAGDTRLGVGSPALGGVDLVAADGVNPWTEFNTLYGLTLTTPTNLGAEEQV